MSTGQKVFWAIIIVIIVIGGYWWYSSSQSMTSSATDTNSAATNIPATTTTDQTQPGTGVSVSVNAAPMTANVVFNGSTFSPASVTIAQGGTVTWTSASGQVWVASDPHPIHNGYDGTTLQQHCAPGYAGATPFDECSGGTTYSFTFDKVGTWGYHDHLEASIMGSVTVVAQ